MALARRIVALAFALVSLSFAQQILILTNGTEIRGRFVSGNSSTITFTDDRGATHRFNTAKVQSLILNTETSPGLSSASATSTTVPPPPKPTPGYKDTDTPPTGAWHLAATIPAGADIVVKIVAPINVRQADPHKYFLALIHRAILNSQGNLAIPRDIQAHLVAREVNGNNGAGIALDLRSADIFGLRVIFTAEKLPLDTSHVNPALLGTILPAVSNVTKSATLNIAPGTIIRFHLERPVYLYE